MQAEKKIFNSRPIFYAFLSLLFAICATRFLFVGDYKYAILIGVVFALFLAFCIWKKRLVTLIIVLSTFLLGVGWYFVGVSTFQGKEYNTICQVEGRVSDDITDHGTGATIVLKNVTINGKKEKNISLYVEYGDTKELNVGDILSFETFVENIKLFELGTFNNGNYRDNTPYCASVLLDDTTLVGNRTTFDEKIRLKAKEVLYGKMGEEYGPVGYAVLFGSKSDVGADIKDYFNAAGIIHILTVSGLHVSFLITLIGFILKKCRVRGWINFLICFAILGLYAYMCGFTPSVMRAGIMGLVLLFTKISGKCYDSLNSVGLAGLIILAYSPLSALDVGFLMSFFCVLGIFIISPWLAKLFRKIFPKFIADSFAISIASQIGILPFAASFFSSINYLSFFVNLLVIPIFSVLYPVLFVLTLLSMGMTFLAPVLKVCAFGFDVIYKIAVFFSNTYLLQSLLPISIFVSSAVFLAMFFVSKYTMLGKRVKVICCSSLLVFAGIFYCVDYNQKPDAGVAYSYCYGNDSVLLTNSSGKTAIVDFSLDYKRLTNVCGVKTISTVFLLDDKSANIKFYRDAGVNYIIRYDGVDGYDEEVQVETDVVGQVDGFEFKYISYDDQVVALEISFDERKFLILSSNIWHTEEEILKLAEENYDIVFLDMETWFAKYFSSSIVLGYFENKNVDKNYLQDGNSFYKINKTELRWRCLD